MKIAAAVLGVVLFGGLVVLAIAGVSAATAVIITAAAVVLMIGLGNAVGGRHTPNRSPYPTGPPAAESIAADPTEANASEADASEAGAGGVEDTGR